MPRAYYNEIDPFAVQWMQNLMGAGLIMPGDIDTRSIEDVKPSELRGYTQCHFFAGIGTWSHALRQAGWPDDRKVWTGSCPCQPFSTAGKGRGTADERHLWPHFHWLIDQCRPVEVYGEQVASNDGLAWLDLVLPDLEGSGYTGQANDLCAAGVGAPHIRQRLYWHARRVGYTNDARLEGHGSGPGPERGHRGSAVRPAAEAGRAGGVAYDEHDGLRQLRHRMGSPEGAGEGEGQERQRVRADPADGRAAGRPGPTNGVWGAADWLWCRDGKWRPVEPGTRPLAPRSPGHVGKLRAYGNGIVLPLAVAYIEATQDWQGGMT